MRSHTLLLLAALLSIASACLLCTPTDAKITRINFPARLPREPLIGGMYWMFVDQFVFDSYNADPTQHWVGRIVLDIKNRPHHATNISFVLFNSEAESFPKLQRQIAADPVGMTCFNRTHTSTSKLAPLYIDPVPVRPDGIVELTVEVTSEQRPYVWMLFLSACNYDHTAPGGHLGGMSLDVHWINPGGYFKKEISWDQQSLLELRAFFFVPVIVLLCAALAVFGVFSIVKRQFHVLVRVFSASFFLYALSLVSGMIHLFVLAANGYGVPELDNLATLFSLASEVIFIALLLLLANGWTITQFEIRYRNLMQLSIGALAIAYASLFVWSNVHVAFLASDYIFCELPGLMIGALRAPIVFFFLFSLVKSIRRDHHKKKRIFYAVLGVVYTAWLCLLPLIIIVAFVISPEWRMRVIDGVQLFITTLAQVGMFALMIASVRMKLFLFHEEDAEVLEAKAAARTESGVYVGEVAGAAVVSSQAGEQSKLIFDAPAEEHGTWQ